MATIDEVQNIKAFYINGLNPNDYCISSFSDLHEYFNRRIVDKRFSKLGDAVCSSWPGVYLLIHRDNPQNVYIGSTHKRSMIQRARAHISRLISGIHETQSMSEIFDPDKHSDNDCFFKLLPIFAAEGGTRMSLELIEDWWLRFFENHDGFNVLNTYKTVSNVSTSKQVAVYDKASGVYLCTYDSAKTASINTGVASDIISRQMRGAVSWTRCNMYFSEDANLTPDDVINRTHIKCSVCGGKYMPRGSRHIYCDKCNPKNPVIFDSVVDCVACGCKFTRSNSSQKYCTIECRDKYLSKKKWERIKASKHDS